MPAPERTSREAIVDAGRDLLESLGLEALTMQAVAARVGVRAPSLYKRVRDREALLMLVAEANVDELGARLADAAALAGEEPRARLIALAVALREFAHDRPRGYGLVFGLSPVSGGLPVDVLARASAPVLDVAARLAGPQHGLEAARTVTAWAHGFLLMELAGAFRLGGDVDAAFAWGIERLADAVSAPG